MANLSANHLGASAARQVAEGVFGQPGQPRPDGYGAHLIGIAHFRPQDDLVVDAEVIAALDQERLRIRCEPTHPLRNKTLRNVDP